MASVIKVENLSKAYQLGDFGTGTISRDLERYWARIRGKEDPFLKIGEINDRTSKGGSDMVWSLKDLNFDIERGDAVGIIGRNGAGKSTLLKILSRVTSPTSGLVKIKGRIASLLEVGTGFHPELTGRENIFLNGAILGMRKAEIKRRFDEIVDFSGVERYVDTPVKRYSSGMYVRLAFAIAAHLESEILIVDEVLAVGDAEFQKKCLGKMSDVSRGEGRTVLFVSHNIGAVQNLCTKGLLLNHGSIMYYHEVDAVIKRYHQLLESGDSITKKFDGNLASRLSFQKIRINDQTAENSTIKINDTICINIFGKCEHAFNRIIFVIAIYCNGSRLFTLRETDMGRPIQQGNFEAQFNIRSGFLRPGAYTIALGAWGNTDDEWLWTTNAGLFTIAETWTNEIRKSDEGMINSEFIRLKNG